MSDFSNILLARRDLDLFATGDDDRLASDPACVLRCKEDDRGSNIIRLSDVSQRGQGDARSLASA
jgi:hypothetical protein